MEKEFDEQLVLTSEQKLEILMPEGKQIAMFTASWCAPCKTMKKVVNSLIESGTDISFRFVDIDANSEWIADACGIKSVPTFVVYENGREKSRLVV